MPNDSPSKEPAVRLMGALLRMPPKPHEDMKLGKPRNPAHSIKSRKRKTKSAAERSSSR
jgi:hypothetical protein